MLIRAGFLISAMLLLALPASAVCSAEYSADQCDQMNLDDNVDTPGGGGGQYCPYYLCGNAEGNAQTNQVWCPEAPNPTPGGPPGAFKDCPIAFCQARTCVGSNCSPETTTCTACPSQTGNNVHVSDCPKM